MFAYNFLSVAEAIVQDLPYVIIIVIIIIIFINFLLINFYLFINFLWYLRSITSFCR